MTEARILILHAPGTNRDEDLAYAFRLAGARPEIVPLSQLYAGGVDLLSYGLLALPGGFSYGDALGAGRLWALDLQTWFQESLQAFVAARRPVLGICNGFQALVKCGLLPSGRVHSRPIATLAGNQCGHFECRWVRLGSNPENPSPWLDGLEPVYCPVAHGEGRFMLPSGSRLPETQVAFRYIYRSGKPAAGRYPQNPNGSLDDIAGITDAGGTVLGLMPHPENHVLPYQHPGWSRGESYGLGLPLLCNGVRMASQSI